MVGWSVGRAVGLAFGRKRYLLVVALHVQNSSALSFTHHLHTCVYIHLYVLCICIYILAQSCSVVERVSEGQAAALACYTENKSSIYFGDIAKQIELWLHKVVLDFEEMVTDTVQAR